MDSGHNAINGGNAQRFRSGASLPVASSNREDIILAPSSSDKKRRTPLIIAIILFVVAVGAGVGAWILGQPSGGGGKNNSASVRSAFNEYANYITKGIDSDADLDIKELEEYSEPFSYYEKIKKLGGDSKEYLKAVNEKFNTFLKVYGGIYSPIRINDFYYSYFLNSHMSMQDILNLYNEVGIKDAQEEVMNKYFVDIDNGLFGVDYVDYVSAELKYVLSVLDYYDYINKFECITGTEVDYECVMQNTEGDDNFYNISDTMVLLEQEANLAIGVLFNSATWTLDEIFHELYNVNDDKNGVSV